MKEWYKEPYFSHRDWILTNASSLSLGTDELLLCLYIDFANEKGIVIDQSILAEKLGLKVEKVNRALKSLVQKKKLVIALVDNRLQFDLEGLFKTDTEEYEFVKNEDLFGAFEEVFARPLTATELTKLADLLREFKEEEIVQALRLADGYQKRSLAYIETILRNRQNYEQ
ncbi:MAG: DnaD domain protein [Erysipelotrichaceae bacterium]|nr:DnaD domain protein [Erysipelotrichaceae bacterium]MBQ1810661.1 DnaD domain protein [Erysipelotrichaceae bacterium]